MQILTKHRPLVRLQRMPGTAVWPSRAGICSSYDGIWTGEGALASCNQARIFARLGAMMSIPSTGDGRAALDDRG